MQGGKDALQQWEPEPDVLIVDFKDTSMLAEN